MHTPKNPLQYPESLWENNQLSAQYKHRNFEDRERINTHLHEAQEAIKDNKLYTSQNITTYDSSCGSRRIQGDESLNKYFNEEEQEKNPAGANTENQKYYSEELSNIKSKLCIISGYALETNNDVRTLKWEISKIWLALKDKKRKSKKKPIKKTAKSKRTRGKK